jgi:hypothetical protein
MIRWEFYKLRPEEQQPFLEKIKEQADQSNFCDLYYLMERSQKWSEQYPDFKRISEIMRSFHADPILSEFRQNNPPASILENIENVYKKCI